MVKRTLISYAFLALTMIFVFLLSYFEKDMIKSHNCSKLEKFYKSTFNGIILKKFINQKNHNTETIIFGNTQELIMYRKGGLFYENLLVGDSISKELNTDTIIVYSNGNITKHKINFDCY